MYKVYFKQAIALLKQNKFISVVSIMATALAIMMVMVLIVVDHIKQADIAPEANRSRLMYVNRSIKLQKDTKNTNNDALESAIVADLKRDLKSPDLISATSAYIEFEIPANISVAGRKLGISADCRPTDAAYWQIYSFDFLEGKGFGEADIQSGLNHVVLVESLAKELFGKNPAVGQTININRVDFKVVGVVRDVSKAFEYAYSQLWVPYTTLNYQTSDGYALMMMVQQDKVDALMKEFRAYEKKWDALNDGWTLELRGPYSHSDMQYNTQYDQLFLESKKRKTYQTIFFFSLLLIIPAINLSGLGNSRVMRRMEEIGVRKAFGAKKGILLMQILYENFITALIGGLLGMLLSFYVVSVLKDWLLESTDKAAIPLDAFLSLPLLLSVVLVSFILNLLSSAIPAWRAANLKIVDSLTLKKN